MSTENETRDAGMDGGRGPRSPGYTSTPLAVALEKTKRLKEYAPARKPIPIDTALKVLGYSPKSGGGLQLIASLKKYGLIDDSGSTDTRAIRVSDMANAILIDQRPGSPERAALLRKAALSPKMNADIRERWPHGLPDDATVAHWLAGERAFNEKYIPAYLKSLRETFEYVQLDSEPDTDENSGDSGLQEEDGGGQMDQQIDKQKQKPAEPGVREFSFPLMEGVATLRVPHPMGEDNYNLLKAVLEAMKAALIGPKTPPME